jgi:hypothetical protein
VLAQFKGEVRDLKTDRVVRVLESDVLEVSPEETIEFRMFFIPEQEGNYLVSGRVTYNNKITFEERSRTIKVEGASATRFGGAFYLILYFILGLTILIMISKIRKAKKRF